MICGVERICYGGHGRTNYDQISLNMNTVPHFAKVVGILSIWDGGVCMGCRQDACNRVLPGFDCPGYHRLFCWGPFWKIPLGPLLPDISDPFGKFRHPDGFALKTRIRKRPSRRRNPTSPHVRWRKAATRRHMDVCYCSKARRCGAALLRFSFCMIASFCR